MAEQGLDPQIDSCRYCGEPIIWSLDHRRWIHEYPRGRHCVYLFDGNGNPTTPGAEPVGDSTEVQGHALNDLLTAEQRQQLQDDLNRMARQRRQAEAESRNLWMP